MSTRNNNTPNIEPDNSILLPVGLLSLSSFVLSGGTPTILGVAGRTILLMLGIKFCDLIRLCVVGVLREERAKNRTKPLSEMTSRQQNWEWFMAKATNIIVVAAIIFGVWYAWDTMIENQQSQSETPISAELILHGDLDVDASSEIWSMERRESGVCEYETIITVSDESGVRTLVAGEPLTVSIPYTVSVVNATRVGEEMQTYTETYTASSEDENRYREVYFTYDFNPNYYVQTNGGDFEVGADPLPMVFSYAIEAEFQYNED